MIMIEYLFLFLFLFLLGCKINSNSENNNLEKKNSIICCIVICSGTATVFIYFNILKLLTSLEKEYMKNDFPNLNIEKQKK